jgi:hypothetical protein
MLLKGDENLCKQPQKAKKKMDQLSWKLCYNEHIHSQQLHATGSPARPAIIHSTLAVCDK